MPKNELLRKKKKEFQETIQSIKIFLKPEWGNTAIAPRVNVFNFVLISYHHRYNQGLKKTLNKPFKLPGITSDIYADVYDAIH